MNYLELVNKVLDESGKEQDPLTLIDWSSAEAGRRLYPRVKRLVREAWKMLQMTRNEWEFNSGELVTTIFPKLKFIAGIRAGGEPPVSSVWVGDRSGTSITITSVTTTDDWTVGEAYGQIQFVTNNTASPVVGETFYEQAGVGVFEYTGVGSYKLTQGPGRVREPRWNTVKAKTPGVGYSSLHFVPWNQFLLGGLAFGHSHSVPYYLSQDYMGDLVFYTQAMQPFTLSFVYDMAPQELTLATDVPEGLPLEFHDWIAWEALMNLARFDKDPDLFGYAESMATTYRQRAERNLMPQVEWAASAYDR